MKSAGILLIFVAAFTLASPSAAETLQVNCDKSKTIGSVLKRVNVG